MRAAGRDPGHGRKSERGVSCIREGDPALEVLPRHLRVVGDQPGQIHRVVIAGVVEIERELVILPDALSDFLQVRDLDAEERLFYAVVEHHFSVTLASERLQLGEDFFCGHWRSEGWQKG